MSKIRVRQTKSPIGEMQIREDFNSLGLNKINEGF